jgi:hypothetical protein
VAVLYPGRVVGANWTAEHLGLTVGFGLKAATVVYAGGPVLVVRDWAQRFADPGPLWFRTLFGTGPLTPTRSSAAYSRRDEVGILAAMRRVC